MKIVFTFALLLTFPSVFAQQTMFWNDYASLNPATSGLIHKQEAYINLRDRFGNYGNRLDAASANYNIRVADKHGLGIQYKGQYTYHYGNSVGLNYNYQFKIGESKLAVGTAISFSHTKLNEGQIEYFQDSIGFRATTSNLYVNLGAAYRLKELLVGVTMTNVTTPDFEIGIWDPRPSKIGFSVHASYDVQLEKKWELTPRAVFTSSDGFHNFTMDLTTTFSGKYSVGLLSKNNNHSNNVGIHIGWDIHEKFRVSYMQSRAFSKLSSGLSPGAEHYLTLGFLIK